MKRYITLILLVFFTIVLDFYAVKGLGMPEVASFKREFLYQYFSGSAFDWIGLIIVNATWLFIGYSAAKEKDFYEETPYPFIIGFIVASILGIMLIYWL